MRCICNVVNCIRRNLFCCGNSSYNNSRYREPRTNVTCANQRNQCFEPCYDERSTGCHKHHHDCGCDD